MRQFRHLTDAYFWCRYTAGTSACTVIIHGDPYAWVDSNGVMVLIRQYPSDFYLRVV